MSPARPAELRGCTEAAGNGGTRRHVPRLCSQAGPWPGRTEGQPRVPRSPVEVLLPSRRKSQSCCCLQRAFSHSQGWGTQLPSRRVNPNPRRLTDAVTICSSATLNQLTSTSGRCRDGAAQAELRLGAGGHSSSRGRAGGDGDRGQRPQGSRSSRAARGSSTRVRAPARPPRTTRQRATAFTAVS